MAKVDFSQRAQAEAWSNRHSDQERSLIASREALRVLPNVSQADEGDFAATALAAFWGVLIASVRGARHSIGLDGRRAYSPPRSNSYDDRVGLVAAAARSAHQAAGDSGLRTRSFLAALAYGQTFSASSSLNVTMASLDAERIDAEKALGPLWGSTEVPDDVRQIHDTFLDALAQDPDWQFWRRWYLEMWNGTFQDWSLANEIAVIEDDLWEGDDALSKVAARIRDIEARRVERELPQVDEVFLDTNGLYEVRSVFREPADLLDGIFNRVSFAFDTAVQSNSCDLNGTSLAAKILRQALENCRDDPNAVEQYFREAVSFIEGNIADGHFAEDDELGFLVNTLKETALQLRADHPTVAEASDARLKRRLKEIDERKALELAESIENMREGTGQRLSEQFALAAETARAMHAPQAQASAIRRSANHAAKISLKESARSASDLAKKAESSGFMASIKMSMRADKLVDLVNWLISGGG